MAINFVRSLLRSSSGFDKFLALVLEVLEDYAWQENP